MILPAPLYVLHILIDATLIDLERIIDAPKDLINIIIPAPRFFIGKLLDSPIFFIHKAIHAQQFYLDNIIRSLKVVANKLVNVPLAILSGSATVSSSAAFPSLFSFIIRFNIRYTCVELFLRLCKQKSVHSISFRIM